MSKRGEFMAPPKRIASAETKIELPVFETKLEAPVLEAPSKSDFTFQRLTLDTALFTDAIRKGFEKTTIFPEGIFFGPLTSDVTVKGRADWGYNNPNVGPAFFTSFGGGKFKTDGAPNANGYFLQAGFGVVRNKAPLLHLGNDDYHFNLGGGLQTLGLGLSLYNFDQVKGSPVLRLDAIDESSFINAKLGNFRLGLKLFTTQTGINFGGSDIPKVNGKFNNTKDYIPPSSIEPLSFTLSYDFDKTPVEAQNRETMYPGEVYTTVYDFAARRLSSHLTLQRAMWLVDTKTLLEAGVQGAQDSQGASSTARWGINLFELKTSLTYGGLAADLEYALLRANNQEKWILGGTELASTLGLCLHAGLGSKSDEGYLGNFSPRASKIACVNNVEAQALGFLGGFGLLGKPNGDSTDQTLFWVTHGVFLAVGVVGLVNYWRPFGKDPDSVAYNGGTGVIDPFKMPEDMDNRLLLGTLLTTPGVYAINSWLNLRNFKVGVAPLPDGAMGTVTITK